MLKELSIVNYAVIDKLSIELGPRFNVITGETGAGKTLLINALSLILGERADMSKIKDPSKKTQITGMFEVDYSIIEQLASIDIEAENPLIIRRVINPSGHSRAYINDSPVTLKILKGVGNVLVDMHGQHEHQLLLSNINQRRIIDAVAGNEEKLAEYMVLLDKYNDLKEEKARIAADIEEFRKEKEYIEYALQELSSIDLDKIDEDTISKRLYEMENYEDIKQILSEIYELTESEQEYNLLNFATEIEKRAKSIKSTHTGIDSIRKLAQQIRVNAEEISSEIVSLEDAFYLDEEELAVLRDKVGKLDTLKRKYNMDKDGLIGYRNKLEEKISIINFPEEKLHGVEKAMADTLKNMKTISAMLHKKRSEVSKKFEGSVNKALKDLNMKDSSLKVDIDYEKDRYERYGCDRIEFLLKNRFNRDGMPLKDIASGGELSRIMLAMKSTLTVSDPVTTMVFDEIDTGISGKTAEMAADMMNKLSSDKQLIVITHLPQIAAAGSNHLFVSKQDNDIDIEHIDSEQRVNEIARLLGASIARGTAVEHARALLEKK